MIAVIRASQVDLAGGGGGGGWGPIVGEDDGMTLSGRDCVHGGGRWSCTYDAVCALKVAFGGTRVRLERFDFAS